MTTLDGNALAGPLRELFAVDLTAARITCDHCSGTWVVAEHVLYTDAPALVLRCRGCSGVLLRCATDGSRFELTGSRLIATS